MAFHLVQKPNGNTVMQEHALGSGKSEFVIEFADGREIGFGAGQANADGLNQTVIRLQNEDGDNRYIQIDGTTISASTAKP